MQKELNQLQRQLQLRRSHEWLQVRKMMMMKRICFKSQHKWEEERILYLVEDRFPQMPNLLTQTPKLSITLTNKITWKHTFQETPL